MSKSELNIIDARRCNIQLVYILGAAGSPETNRLKLTCSWPATTLDCLSPVSTIRIDGPS